jgi:hypothetical protein
MAPSEMQFIICNAGVEAVTCKFKVADKSVTGGADAPVKQASKSQADEPSVDAPPKGRPKVGWHDEMRGLSVPNRPGADSHPRLA